jgi:general secretion pathway protein A
LRKTASVPVWLRNEQLSPLWEEETETQVLSRHGAGLHCRHSVLTKSTLVIIRRDNGRRANARVRHSRYNPDGERELGIEFIDEQNFWDLDWNSSEAESPILARDASAAPVLTEAEIVEIVSGLVADENTADDSAPSIQEAVSVVVVTPCIVPDEATADARASSIEQAVKVVVIAPRIVIEDVAEKTSTPPVQAEAEIVEIASNLVSGDRAAETNAPPVQEVTEVVRIVSSPDVADNAVDTSAPQIQAEIEIMEIIPRLVNDESTLDGSAYLQQEGVEILVPRTLPVACRNEASLSLNFLSFYGLSGQPFDVTPDPEYLYLSHTHREALTSLAQGIQNVRGFMALVAGPGLGKTILLNKLMEDLRDSTRIVFLFQTQCNSRELLRYLLSELGVEHAGMDVVTMHKALNEILFREMLKGRRFVLIVDEAQNLRESVLETIRLLSDFETTHTKLIQIILSGQPALVDTLMRPSLSQLRQRIAILATLEPLSAADTVQYIDHRLRMAGSGGKPIFTPDALTLVGEQSKGVPRIINNLCSNALVLGYSQGSNPIDSEIGQKVVAKSDLESLARRSLGPSVNGIESTKAKRAAS